MQTTIDILQQLFQNYESFKETSISQRRFSHQQMQTVLEKYKSNRLFTFEKLGESFQQREINLIKIGNGATKILLWSQMHGNESTATAAILDLFNLFTTSDKFDNLRHQILNNLTLYFIPMLNPDGAEIFKRRNAQGIDINRDARKQQTVEAQILLQVADKIKPAYGFNLHDQNPHYTVGRSKNPAAISFLAPSFDYQKSVNTVRENAMKLIVALNKSLQMFIPNQVAKYNDDYSPRCFGDTMQSKGISTILVESGWTFNDFEKQIIRKLNFILLLHSFVSIAQTEHQNETIENYYAIKENDEHFYDCIIRNAILEKDGKKFLADIGVMNTEIPSPNNSFTYKGTIDDIGDMADFFAWNDFDASGMVATAGKTFPQLIENLEQFKNLNVSEMLSNGFTTLRVNDEILKQVGNNIAVKLISRNENYQPAIQIDNIADFVLIKNDAVKFVFANGKLNNCQII